MSREETALVAKVKMANAHLNKLYMDTGLVMANDIFEVVTPSMRENGARIEIRSIANYDWNGNVVKPIDKTPLEFVRLA
jgi:hypothetical protein